MHPTQNPLDYLPFLYVAVQALVTLVLMVTLHFKSHTTA